MFDWELFWMLATAAALSVMAFALAKARTNDGYAKSYQNIAKLWEQNHAKVDKLLTDTRHNLAAYREGYDKEVKRHAETATLLYNAQQKVRAHEQHEADLNAWMSRHAAMLDGLNKSIDAKNADWANRTAYYEAAIAANEQVNTDLCDEIDDIDQELEDLATAVEEAGFEIEYDIRTDYVDGEQVGDPYFFPRLVSTKPAKKEKRAKAAATPDAA